MSYFDNAPTEGPTANLNDPRRAGADASDSVRFGDCGRYAAYAVHTRGDAVSWFVADAETPDPLTELASVIRQEDTYAAAVAGL